jgi:hypothetical protein
MSELIPIIHSIKRQFLSGLIARSRAIMLLRARTNFYDKEIYKMISEWEKEEDESRT